MPTTPNLGLPYPALADVADGPDGFSDLALAVDALVSRMLPPGLISPFGGATAPTGWLLCDGTAVSRTVYANLFAAIGTAWGAGDGSGTFNLPDLRGRAAIGSGTGAGLTARSVGQKAGAETIALAVGNLPSHNHGGATAGIVGGASVLSHQHTMSFYSGGVNWNPAYGYPPGQPFLRHYYANSSFSVAGTGFADGDPAAPGYYTDNGSDLQHSHLVSGTSAFAGGIDHTHTVNAQGSGTPADKMPPFGVVAYVIKT